MTDDNKIYSLVYTFCTGDQQKRGYIDSLISSIDTIIRSVLPREHDTCWKLNLGPTHIWFKESDMLFCTIDTNIANIRLIENIRGLEISIKHPGSSAWKRIALASDDDYVVVLNELQKLNATYRNTYLVLY